MSTPAADTAAPETGEHTLPAQRVLQRLILPLEASPDIVPLYIEREDARSGATGGSFGLGSASSRKNAIAAKTPRVRNWRPR